MSISKEHTGRFGGSGSSHQDREHPGKNHQPTGHKGGGDRAGTAPAPGTPANPSRSRNSGGGERDRHRARPGDRS